MQSVAGDEEVDGVGLGGVGMAVGSDDGLAQGTVQGGAAVVVLVVSRVDGKDRPWLQRQGPRPGQGEFIEPIEDERDLVADDIAHAAHAGQQAQPLAAVPGNQVEAAFVEHPGLLPAVVIVVDGEAEGHQHLLDRGAGGVGGME